MRRSVTNSIWCLINLSFFIPSFRSSVSIKVKSTHGKNWHAFYPGTDHYADFTECLRVCDHETYTRIQPIDCNTGTLAAYSYAYLYPYARLAGFGGKPNCDRHNHSGKRSRSGRSASKCADASD